MAAPISHPNIRSGTVLNVPPEASTNLTTRQGYNMAASAITSAANAYASYNTAKHEARLADINYTLNKGIALENLKINQYIINRNEVEILDASAEEKLSITTQSLEAKAEAEVAQAAVGMKGGSATQAVHAISREAEKAESKRLSSLDSALFASKVQLFSAESSSLAQAGIRPVGGASGALAVGSAAATFAEKLHSIMQPIQTGD